MAIGSVPINEQSACDKDTLGIQHSLIQRKTEPVVLALNFSPLEEMEKMKLFTETENINSFTYQLTNNASTYSLYFVRDIFLKRK